ncbi:hypothetical protein ACFVUS_27145 [Nocardia sp. NPDC058058]|uniref:hypothetical protein n=1 Tax=Nocardia sp. NPDC058058 TaxID=3346317 RepID=UPI0036DE0C9B
MSELHPDVQAGFAMKRELRQRMDETLERAEGIVARRPSPSGLVIPEVDVMSRLRTLYLAPGTCGRFGNQELITEIMVAIAESAADVKRQYDLAMNETSRLPRPLREAMRQWRTESGPEFRTPNFGRAED